MTHLELLRTITALVRSAGPAAALEALREQQPTIPVPGGDAHPGYHETLATFHVWAVHRLVEAGLSDVAVVWHPLTDARSALAWWDPATLRSDAARRWFVASTLAEPWEPVPAPAGRLVAA